MNVIVVPRVESFVTLSTEYTYINIVVGTTLFVGWLDEYWKQMFHIVSR
jgi:hypothetical protein